MIIDKQLEDALIKDSLEFSANEIMFRDYFLDWLPDVVIDSHTHTCEKQFINNIDDGVANMFYSSFAFFGVSDSLKLRVSMYPGKVVHSLRFSSIILGTDFQGVNNFLANSLPIGDSSAYMLSVDNYSRLASLSFDPFCAIKVYWRSIIPPVTVIREIIPDELALEAQLKSIPIILHLPKPLTFVVEEVVEIARRFPKLKIIIPHMGVPQWYEDWYSLKSAYELLSPYKNIYFDTAMVISAEPIYLAYLALGVSRILFGSDEPINLVRADFYFNENVGKKRFISKYPYRWVDLCEQESNISRSTNVVHLHWLQLSAVRDFINRLPANSRDFAKKSIFYTNFNNLFT